MRHKVQRQSKLGREADHRGLLVRNLATSLVIHQRVKTTPAKARLVRSVFEQLITRVRSQKEEREAIRILKTKLLTEQAQKKILKKLIPQFKERASGFTRITNLKIRKGDSAPEVLLELL